ncbi:MAG TPA: CoA-acylating methylmalonate-semialdehyde dehydrogenase [Candidatus Baltobacteraceae bacterium]|jgi:malonate-semialdehyde dehydrogenase (acetylating)/methylmalonate-semialdehyde dehydrogenase|nr:CoA-acylating methylmalonate-semialdehyde dehydrogenase [Candidatus Baltobacteraceae bacterium]
MAVEMLEVRNPATGEVIANLPAASQEDCRLAVERAARAYPEWSQRPVVERARLLFRYADALERRFEDLARSVSSENGKTIGDARAEVRRGIEAVEFACGMPTLMMGDALGNVARGVDSVSLRFPLGVCVGITPFNFPAMIPLWMMPIAVAAGNTFVLKPSPQTPVTSDMLYQISNDSGFPSGVFNVVHGGAQAVEALIEAPAVQAVSFVGSSSVARSVQELAVRHHKRVQALGGAKNYLIVMPDAANEQTLNAVLSSAFGGAGQRCLAGSVVVTVGDAARTFVPMLVEAARALRIGPGIDADVDMGPVISAQSRQRITGYIARARESGAKVLLDGSQSQTGEAFIAPTIFDDVDPDSELATEEIFGPVVAVVHADSLDTAIDIANRSRYGNASSIFTADGKSAREFGQRIAVGMVGINIGVAAPMAFFAFGGVKDSIFGDLRCHGKDAVAFYTQQRVVISRWP